MIGHRAGDPSLCTLYALPRSAIDVMRTSALGSDVVCVHFYVQIQEAVVIDEDSDGPDIELIAIDRPEEGSPFPWELLGVIFGGIMILGTMVAFAMYKKANPSLVPYEPQTYLSG